MGALQRIRTLAANTLLEAIRSKILFTLLFFALVMIASGLLVGTLSYVDGDRIVQDVGLASIRLFGTAIAIFLGVGLIFKEVERRTIYTILSKPTSRTEFFARQVLWTGHHGVVAGGVDGGCLWRHLVDIRCTFWF